MFAFSFPLDLRGECNESGMRCDNLAAGINALFGDEVNASVVTAEIKRVRATAWNFILG